MVHTHSDTLEIVGIISSKCCVIWWLSFLIFFVGIEWVSEIESDIQLKSANQSKISWFFVLFRLIIRLLPHSMYRVFYVYITNQLHSENILEFSKFWFQRECHINMMLMMMMVWPKLVWPSDCALHSIEMLFLFFQFSWRKSRRESVT